jgi:formylglycine-generating enzyme required for sulfatase activity
MRVALFRAGLVALAVAGAIAACSSGDGAPSGGTPDPDGGGPTVDGGNCGRNTAPCVTGAGCKGPQDCQAGDACFGGVCTLPPATCMNGVKDSNETDVDCGGSCAPCADGRACAAPADCVDGVCNGTCQAPSCTDAIQNGAETGLDCGGACPTKCADGGGCKVGADCASGACSPMNVCTPPSCTDGVKNGTETGLDCGGSCATKCAPGQGCASDADCAAVRCDAVKLVCLPPTSTDGLQNGTETDVDCGGGAPTNAPRCAVGKGCALDGDCTVACNYASKCVSARSCKVQHGGDTCGPAGANESCCTSLPAAGLPGGSAPTATIDKYNITAGRFRAFVTAVGGDIKTWIANNTPAWWSAGWNAYLPSTLDDGSYGSPHAGSSLTEWMGPYLVGAVAGGNMGCEIKANGARSYRLSDAINAGFGDEQDYTQDFDDERALNCVTAYLVAAFCAWDGAHMPTPQQIDHLWVNASVPWGAPAAAGYSAANPADPLGAAGSAVYTNGATKAAPIPLADLRIANWNYNYWGGVPVNKTDYTIYIAPPGRFPAGNGKYGHSDLGGSVFNFTTINGGNVYWSRSGSWQGHAIPFTAAGVWSNFPATNKYWATGGRCAR